MTSESVIERVAKALWKSGSDDQFPGGEMGGAYISQARAAIEAMRSPTEEMVASIGLAASIESGCIMPYEVVTLWGGLIDTALKEAE